MRIRRTVAATAAIALLVTALTATAGTAQASVAPTPALTGHVLSRGQLPAPVSTTDCQAQFSISCYTPNQLHVAYDLAPLYQRGITGRGKTIAIVDSFGSPTIRNDLAVFDKEFGLPAPPSLRIIAPVGPIPAFDPTNGTVVGWAEETSLDVEYAHAIAPGANILLVETPVAETEGVTGFPQIVAAENYVINHNLADVITQSFGATENTFPSKQSLLNLRSAYVNAFNHHVTVLAASGDEGVTNDELDGATLYPMPVNSWPSSDPLVTSIGGTMLSLNNAGQRIAPDAVWNDGFGAGGGGLSQVFARPAFQNGVRNVVGASRGTPDISMSAAVNGAVWVYWSFAGAGAPGYELIGGTSEASPLFSGIVALADQVAHHRLGDLNPGLYLLNYARSVDGLVDVTTGNNSFAGVTGYSASRGYDLASGLGTVDAARFVPSLAAVG
jgi:subtilase family serine protease